MDINLLLPKDQQRVERADMIDWISKLPDEILGKILNYLSTKEAAATSILSKRWEHLWTLASDLDFSDDWLYEYDKAENKNENGNDYVIKRMSFQKYVDTVIFHHGESNIRKCSFSFRTNYFVSSLYSWICALIDCNIHELSLYCGTSSSGPYDQLPWRLFSCNTLVVLKIKGINFVLDVPTHVYFPRLKFLHIGFALFVDDASTKRLFSSCPVLEDLNIGSLRTPLQIMNISVPSLRRLWLYSKHITFQTDVNTPCLEYLHIINFDSDQQITRYFFNITSSSLVCAHVKGLNVFILNAITQVECLTLSANDMSLQNIIRDSALPVFKNLKTLKLDVGIGVRSTPNDWIKVLPLLDSSPNLQLLIFPHGLVRLAFIDEEEFSSHFNWQRPESVPQCLSTHLKTIEIFKFVGFPEELQMVEYLLEFGKVLEKLIIHGFDVSEYPIMDNKKLDKAVFELFSVSTRKVPNFKRSSSTCEIIFTGRSCDA